MKNLSTLLFFLFVTATAWAQPVITQQPVDGVGCEGGSASMTVAATGNNLTYQWKRFAVNLVDGQPEQFTGIIPTGVNTPTLTGSALPLGYTWGFACEVSDGVNSVTSTMVYFTGIYNGHTGSAFISDPTEYFFIDQPNFTLCSGMNINLGTVSGPVGTTYQWNNGQTGMGFSATPMANTVYSVTVTTLPGCVNVYSTTVTVNNCSSPTVVADIEPLPVCPSTGNAVAAVWVGGGNISYQWKKDGVDIPGANAFNYYMANPVEVNQGTYTCRMTNPNGTLLSDPYFLDVRDSLHIISQNMVTDATFCSPATVHFEMVYTGEPAPGQTLGFNWTDGVNTIGVLGAVDDFGPWAGNLGGDYFPWITNGCNATVAPDTFHLEIIEGFAPYAIEDPNNNTVVAYGGTYDSFLHWNFNGTPIPGATNVTYFPTASGDYTAVVRRLSQNDPNYYCDLTSNALTININGINTVNGTEALQLYPNPTNGEVILEGLEMGAVLRIFNTAGQLAFATIVTSEKQAMDLSPLPSGTYMVQMASDRGAVNARVVKN